MKLIGWIVGVALAAIAVVFSVLNANDVTVFYDPLNGQSVEIALSYVGIIALSLGFVCGSLIVWINGGAIRKQCREQKKTIKKLESQLQETEE